VKDAQTSGARLSTSVIPVPHVGMSGRFDDAYTPAKPGGGVATYAGMSPVTGWSDVPISKCGVCVAGSVCPT
jgi:hypothetical protein